MPIDTDFTNMLRTLAGLFQNERRPGGNEAATALAKAITTRADLPPARTLDINANGIPALDLRPHPCVSAIKAALPLISWHHSGLENKRIRPAIALEMATAELIGPDGMIFHPSVRVGLFMQAAGLDYVTRTHPAEETFVMLGGSGYWSCNGSAPRRQEAGAYIFHPSGVRHSSVTREEPFIAAWRWNGDIAYEGYSLEG